MENSFVFYRNISYNCEWENINGSFIKGYAYKESALLNGDCLISEIINAIEEEHLQETLFKLNGFFAAIISYCDCVYLIADKIRSYPILYSIKEDGLICADSGDTANELGDITCLNLEVEREFAAVGYVCGADSLVAEVMQVPAGSFVTYRKNGDIEINSYHTFSCPKRNISLNDLYSKSIEKLEASFCRTIQSLGTYSQILIPLSGGYDSRLIACLCKKMGINNVLCFTYGKPDSFEVEISEKVAKALGYKWVFVEYNKEVWDKVLDSQIFQRYFIFSGCLTGTPHFQDFPALLQLQRDGLIDNNTVVIPGHSGDLLGGSKIPVEVLENPNRIFTSSFLVNMIYTHLFELNQLNDEEEKSEKERIKKLLCLQDDKTYSIDEFLDLFECEWFIKCRIANFIVNSTRAYEFMGMRWRLPLWDNDFASLWYSIPWKMKFYSKSYENFMFDNYFKQYGVNIHKERASLSAAAKRVLKRVLPESIKTKYRSRVSDRMHSNHESNFNAFEYVINWVENKIDKVEFDYIKSFNHSGINAATSLFYITQLKNKLQ